MFSVAVPAKICLSLLLTAASPFQQFIDRPGFTHEFCNQQAIRILRNDGLTKQALLYEEHLAELNLGVYWADTDWKNIHHYFEPRSQKGLLSLTSASDVFQTYYETAIILLRQRDIKKGIFFLGAAAHLVQDMCVPHHARAKLFDGHKQYENWVQERCLAYAVDSGGSYCEGRPSCSLLINNARMAAEFWDDVIPTASESRFHYATSILLTQAQQATAGLLLKFTQEIKKEDLSILSISSIVA